MDRSTYYHARVAAPPPRPPLDGRAEARIGIVGGGLAGLATALSLAERGHAPILLEAGRFGDGASGRNGGMVSAGFAAAQEGLERRLGLDRAKALMRLSRDGIALIRDRVRRHGMPVGLMDGVVIAAWFKTPGGLEGEVEGFNQRYGTALVHWPEERLRRAYPSRHYHDGILDPEGFHLDPLQLCRGYADAAEKLGARLHEATPALAVERSGKGWRVRTGQGQLDVQTLVLCQSAYPPPLLAPLARSVLSVVTYIIVTGPLDGRHADVIRAPHAVYDTRFATGYYRRLPDGRLLWGGRISLVERPRDLAGLMRRDLAFVYPELADAPIEHGWSGRMGFTRHKMPLVRALKPGLWTATAFGGHGLNTTTMAGELVATALVEGDRRFELFDPFGPSWVGGPLGPLAAQALYWTYAARDAVRGWYHRHR